MPTFTQHFIIKASDFYVTKVCSNFRRSITTVFFYADEDDTDKTTYGLFPLSSLKLKLEISDVG